MTSSELKAARKRLNLTAKEMAKSLNTPQKTYECWEYKGKIPGIVEVAIRSKHPGLLMLL